MSDVVETKVVEMKFDNANFEKNVQTSMGTLAKLKQALSFENAAKSFVAIEKKASEVTLNGLQSAVDTVNKRFSVMGEIGTRVLQNLTDSAYSAGSKIVKAMSVQGMSDGFEEYELKMGAVQTIMNSSGASMDTVNKKLAELNTYSDKTIYSFRDMKESVAKFTNAGVDLDTSVRAIEGISNEAALAGANTQEASRAMYNFSQALSSGSVKLIDWKSIENANMATKGFKEELIKTAYKLGTVKKEGDKFVSTTTDAKGSVSEAFNATSKFNDSLSANWLTSEVLLKTLEKYSDTNDDLGKKAFAAAQDLKTFSQVVDTIKESIGSGWAESWEYIFGNFEEAKKLWTGVGKVVGGILDETAKSRNEILKLWHDDINGRSAVLSGLKNLFTIVGALLKPIKQAFRDVFPKTTAKDLIDLSSRFKAFTERLKIGSGVIEKLRNTFRGVFSIFGIGKELVVAFVKAFSELIGSSGGLASGLLSVTSAIGKVLYNLHQYLKNNEVFYKGLHAIVQVLTTGFNAIKPLLDKVGSKIDEIFNKKDATGKTGLIKILESLGEKLKIVGELASAAKDKIKSFFGAFDDKETEKISKKSSFLEKPFQGLAKVAKVLTPVANVFKKVAKTFVELIDNISLSNFIELIKSGILASVGSALLQFFRNFGSAKKEFGGFFDRFRDAVDNFVDILGTLKSALKTFIFSVKAKALLLIAIALAVMSVSLIALSAVPTQKLAASLGILAGALATLGGGVKLISKLLEKVGAVKLGVISLSLMIIAGSIVDLVEALLKMSEIPFTKLLQGLAGLAGVAIILGAAFVGVTKIVKGSPMAVDAFDDFSDSLLKVGIAMWIFSKAFKNFAKLDFKGLMISLGALGGTLAILIFALKKMPNDMPKVSIGLIGIAASIFIISGALKIISTIPIEKIGSTLLIFGGAMISLGVALKLMPKNLPAIGAGLLLVSVGLVVISGALKILSTFTWDQVGVSLTMLAGALITLTIAMNKMPKNLPAIGAGLILVSGGILVISGALRLLGTMSLESVVASLVALAGAMLIICVAMNKMPKNLIVIGAGLVVVSSALLLLSAALRLLGTMSWESVGTSLTELAGAMLILGVAVNFMKGCLGGAAAMIVVAGAVLILAPALLALGQLSLEQVAVSLIALGGSFAILGIAGKLLGPLVPSIFALSASLLTFGIGVASTGLGVMALSSGIAKLVAVFVLAYPTIRKAMGDIINAIGPTIKAIGKGIAEGIISFAETISKGGPKLKMSAGSVLSDILDGARKTLPKIVSTLGELVFGVLKWLGSKIETFANAAIELATGFINGLANGIRNNTETIMNAVANLLSAILEFILSALQKLLGGIPYVGKKISGALEKAKGGIRDVLAPEEARSTAEKYVKAAGDGATSQNNNLYQSGSSAGGSILSGAEDKLSGMFNVGSTGTGDLVGGLLSKEPELSNVMGMLNGDMTEGFNIDGYDIGGDNMNELLKSYTNGEPSIDKITKKIAKTSGDNFDISNITNKLGRNADISYGHGMDGNIFMVKNSAGKVAKASTDEFEKVPQKTERSGRDAANSNARGIESGKENARRATRENTNAVINEYGRAKEPVKRVADQTAAGYNNRLKRSKPETVSAVQGIVNSALSAAKKALGIASPSKEFGKIGAFSMAGYVEGVGKQRKKVANASASVATTALQSFGGTMDAKSRDLMARDGVVQRTTRAVKEQLKKGITSKPRITPVVDDRQLKKDLKKVKSGVKDATTGGTLSFTAGQPNTTTVKNDMTSRSSSSGGYFGATSSSYPMPSASSYTPRTDLSPASNYSNTASNTSSITQDHLNALKSFATANNYTQNNILDQVRKVRQDINQLTSTMAAMKIQLDTGALVGNLVVPIDKALARQAFLHERG